MKCPDCGEGEIKETQKAVKFTKEGEPTRIRIKVACEKCGHVLHDDYEDI